MKMLHSLGPTGGSTRTFKVKFCAGTAAVETAPLDADDSIEWTELIEMRVHDAEAPLVATIFSTRSSMGPWSLVPGGRFEGFPVNACPSVWRPMSGAGPSFSAELETVLEGNSSKEDVELPPMLDRLTNEGVHRYGAAVNSARVNNCSVCKSKALTWEHRHSSESTDVNRSISPEQQRPSFSAEMETVLDGNGSEEDAEVPPMLGRLSNEGVHSHLSTSVNGSSVYKSRVVKRDRRSSSGGTDVNRPVSPEQQRPCLCAETKTVLKGNSSEVDAELPPILDRLSNEGVHGHPSTSDNAGVNGSSVYNSRAVKWDRRGSFKHTNIDRPVSPEQQRPSLCAEMETTLGGNSREADAELPPMLVRLSHDGVHSHPSIFDNAGVNSSSVYKSRLVKWDRILPCERTDINRSISPEQLRPSFCAEMETVLEGKSSEESAELPPMLDRLTNEGFHGHVSTSNSAGVNSSTAYKSRVVMWDRRRSSERTDVNRSISPEQLRSRHRKRSTTHSSLRERSSSPKGRHSGAPSASVSPTRRASRDDGSATSPQDGREGGPFTRIGDARSTAVKQEKGKCETIHESKDSYPRRRVAPQFAGMESRRAAAPPLLEDGKRSSSPAQSSVPAPTVAGIPLTPPKLLLASESKLQPPPHDEQRSQVPRVSGDSKPSCLSAQPTLTAYTNEGAPLPPPILPLATEIGSSPLLYDDRPSLHIPVPSVDVAVGRLQRRPEFAEPGYQYKPQDHPDALGSSCEDGAKAFPTAETSTRAANNTTLSSVHALEATVEPCYIGQRAPRLIQSPAVTRRSEGDVPSYTAPVSPTPSPAAVDQARLHAAGALPPLGGVEKYNRNDAVCVSCVAPPYVYGGACFELKVVAYLHQDREKAIEVASRPKETVPKELGSTPDALGKRVTVNLEFPDNAFKIVDPNRQVLCNADSSIGDEKRSAEHVPEHLDTDLHDSNKAPRQPLSVQELVWNGNAKNATFRLECLPGAPIGVVQCSACIAEADNITRWSFGIEVAEAPLLRSPSDVAGLIEMGTTRKGVGADVVAIDQPEPTIADDVIGRGAQPRQVFLPPPLLLTSRVDPGQSVHASEEHGFRLTVQEGSLPCAIGPIAIQECAQVVRCEADRHYLVTAVVECQPSGVSFPETPLLMDFRIEDAARAKISQSFQVLVCKDKGKGWRTVKSKVREDEWGTYMHASVSDFCFFVCGREIHPSDPARIENCEQKGMIEVRNATDVELYLVLVPVSFTSDNTNRVTYTGKIGVGVAGVSLNAGISSGHESVENSYMLPAGLTPDDVSVPAGGTFHFEPPPDATKGKLLIATIAEEVQAGIAVRVVVLHGKFITSVGKRRVILPSFLQSKSRISARLGPDDIPVNMVMIMAGLGSNDLSFTAASTPEDTVRREARSAVASVAPSSTAISAAVSPATSRSRSRTFRGCGVS